MNILVLGAGGMAGYTISHYLHGKGHNVTGFARKKLSHCKYIEGDAKNTKLVTNLIKGNKFDTVINCIGILNQFAENRKDMAVYLNSYFPHFLADVTKDIDTQIIHMSTDCVYSGKNGNYTEKDFRDGETFYDRSKALGELEDEKNIKIVQKAMFSSTNEIGGTSYRSRIDNPKYQFAGKTGTAQVKRISKRERELDLKIDQIPYNDRDHALYVAYGPYENPRYALSIIVEHGGSGSKAAAPMAKKLFKLIIDRDALREKQPNFEEIDI